MELDFAKIIGTVIFGGPMFNFIIPLYVMIFSPFNKEISGTRKLVLELGGKIGRGWFFLNMLILASFSFLLIFLNAKLSNWVMIIISIPYFILLFILNWNNVYKRLFSCTNNSRFSLCLTIAYAIYATGIRKFSEAFSDKILTEGIFLILISLLHIFFFVLLLMLFFVPERKVKAKNE